MPTVHVAPGSGRAPTALAAYDAALADANVHNYNIVRVSSVVPADATVERVDRAPDLGPAGNRLTVVESRATAAPDDAPVCAALGWATGPGPGLLYEGHGPDRDAAVDEVEAGLDAGASLREWSLEERGVATAAATPDGDDFAVAVVVAAFGESEPIL